MSYSEFIEAARPLFEEGEHELLYDLCSEWIRKLLSEYRLQREILLIPYTNYVSFKVFELCSNPIIEYIVIRMIDFFEEGIFIEKIVGYFASMMKIETDWFKDGYALGREIISKYRLERIYDEHPGCKLEIYNCIMKGRMFQMYYEEHPAPVTVSAEPEHPIAAPQASIADEPEHPIADKRSHTSIITAIIGAEFIFKIGTKKYRRILMKNESGYYIERVGRGKHMLTEDEMKTMSRC